MASTTAVGELVIDGDLELDLRHIMHGVFGAPVNLLLAFLPAETTHLADRHALHALAGKRLAHGVETMRLDHCDDIFHETLSAHIL